MPPGHVHRVSAHQSSSSMRSSTSFESAPPHARSLMNLSTAATPSPPWPPVLTVSFASLINIAHSALCGGMDPRFTLSRTSV